MWDQELWRRIKTKALDLGIDLVGVADLEPALDFLREQGGPLVRPYPRAISLGMGLLHSVINNLPTREPAAMATYTYLYTSVNTALDKASFDLAKVLEGEGYPSLPVPASQNLSVKDFRGLVSHKLAAHLAGLGWIGKSCLLITPQFGPRIRFATILTTAPLPASAALTEPKCGDCSACVDICPPSAITGKAFSPQEGRELRYSATACKDYTENYRKEIPTANSSTVCGLCVYVCPWGRKKGLRQEKKRGMEKV